LGSLSRVKRLLVLAVLCTAFAAAQAQDQESALVNRLLRPDMSLGNKSQNKKFTADHTSVTTKARVSTFYFQQKAVDKTYTNTREYSAGTFDARSFDNSGTHNNLLAARSTPQVRGYDTPTARASVELRDAHKEVPGNSFAGNRQFTGKGKSQKALDRKNPPMTIEQVRELLNKNK